MSDTRPSPALKPFSYMLIATGLIMLPALTFAISADLPHLVLFAAAGCLLSLLVRRPVPYSDRSVIYSLVVAVVAAVLFDLVFPMRDNRLGYISIFFYPNILVPTLLYLAAAVTMFEASPRALGIVAACSLTGLMFGGDVFNTDIVGERLPFAAPLVKNIYYFYGVMVVLEFVLLIAGLFWCLERGTTAAVAAPLRRRRLLFKMLCVGLTPLLAGGLLALYLKNESTVRMIENYLLRIGVRRLMPGPGRVQFDKQVNLNFTMSPELLQNQGQIVMRVRSRNVPGYLRAKGYQSYKEGIWKEIAGVGPTFNVKKYEGMLAYTTFYLGASPDSGKGRFDIFPDNRFAAEILAVPGNTVRVDIIADKLSADADGMVEVKEWMRDGGYSCFTVKPEMESAWPYPAPPSPHAGYLQVPEELKAPLDKFLAEIAASRPLPSRPLTDSEFIARMIMFFNSKFKYALDWSFDGKGDPIAYFIGTRRQAHCELFASAAALTLRRYGIPCRYITGFICEERHPSGSYYVSRLGNAHAWTEAWDRQQKKWVLVEATPPAGVPNFHHQWGTLEPWRDRATQMFQEVMAMLRRGVVATAIVTVFAGLWSLLVDLLVNPWRGGLALLAALLLWRWWRRRRKKQRRSDAEMEISRRELQREFLALEKRLSRLFGLTRREGETIDEFLARCAQVRALPDDLHELLEEYRRLRYLPSPPDPAALRSWSRRADQRRRNWRKS